MNLVLCRASYTTGWSAPLARLGGPPPRGAICPAERGSSSAIMARACWRSSGGHLARLEQGRFRHRKAQPLHQSLRPARGGRAARQQRLHWTINCDSGSAMIGSATFSPGNDRASGLSRLWHGALYGAVWPLQGAVSALREHHSPLPSPYKSFPIRHTYRYNIAVPREPPFGLSGRRRPVVEFGGWGCGLFSDQGIQHPTVRRSAADRVRRGGISPQGHGLTPASPEVDVAALATLAGFRQPTGAAKGAEGRAVRPDVRKRLSLIHI